MPGLLTDPQQAQGMMPAGQPPQAPPSAPAGNADQIRQIYGLLAQYGKDPTAVGMSYIDAMQAQQRLKQQNDPMEQYLRLYGNINPYDFETASLADFHENLMRTGQWDFNRLKRREDLSSKEQGFLNTAINQAQEAEMTLGRMANIANRFEQLGRQGTWGGYAGRLSEWIKTALASEDAPTLVRTEYEQLRSKEVIRNLPPGVASDVDMKIAMRGWPASTAKPTYIAAFLRGMQKISAIEHAKAAHAAGYISRNRTQQGQLDDWTRNRDWMALEALKRFGGVYAPEGMSPEEAADAYFGEMATQQEKPAPKRKTLQEIMAERKKAAQGK